MTTLKFEKVYNSQPKTEFTKENVKCFCCDKELVEFVLITEIVKPEEKWLFKCPYCGEGSLLKSVSNKMFFNPIKCKLQSVEKEGDIWLVRLS